MPDSASNPNMGDSRPIKRQRTMQPEDDQPPRFVSRNTPIIKQEDDAPPRFVSQLFRQAPTPTPTPSAQSSQPPILTVVPDVKLSDEQQTIVDLIAEGKNVFYTGSAGCGKSTVPRAAVARLRTMKKRVKIVAPTGRAALDVGGTTTWTFAGWTPSSPKRPIEEIERLAQDRFVRKRLQSTDVLIIDEISMVEANFFDRLNRIMKVARGNDKPFGNVQLVVTGDFCQLPPVKPFQYCFHCGKEMREMLASTQYECSIHDIFFDRDKWAFRSEAWKEADFICKHLDRIHRQTDKQLISMLQKIRLGYPLSQDEHTLLLDHPCEVTDAVKLFSTREQVRAINKAEFHKLQTPKLSYYCLDSFKHNPEHRHISKKCERSTDGHTLLANKDHTFDEILELKVGSLVVLLINLNIEQGLFNGSQGRVISFKQHNDADLPKPANKHDVSSFDMDDRQERIATEAVQSIGGSHIMFQMEQVKQFIAQERNSDKLWPVVQFNNGKEVTIYANCRVSELGDDEPYSLLSRTQIPLAAAWAMTIHKSQGMTLDRVIVDLSKAFEEGQEYVALSRARSLKGLKVVGLGNGLTGGAGNVQVKGFLKEKFGIE